MLACADPTGDRLTDRPRSDDDNDFTHGPSLFFNPSVEERITNTQSTGDSPTEGDSPVRKTRPNGPDAGDARSCLRVQAVNATPRPVLVMVS
jgi:hypothetical protein